MNIKRIMKKNVFPKKLALSLFVSAAAGRKIMDSGGRNAAGKKLHPALGLIRRCKKFIQNTKESKKSRM